MVHFDWPNLEAAGFKSQAAVSIKTKQVLNQETWKVVTDPLPHSSSSKLRSPAAEKQKTPRKMKAVIVFMLLFAAVYCNPVKRSTSSSESTEMQSVDGQSDSVPDESSEEEDIDDDADDDDDSDSDESDEITDPTAVPVTESTLIPTINGRGDNIGYQSNYKKHIYYVDGNNVEKGPSSFKARSFNKGNYKGEDLKLFKVLQVDKTGLDQGVEVSSGTESDDISQLEQRSAISASDASDGDSSASQESEENSQSSEEDTTAANTTANDSSESSESEEINVTDQPVVIKNSNPEVVNL